MIKAVKDIDVRVSDIRITDVFIYTAINAVRSATVLTSKNASTADDIKNFRITEYKVH